MAVVGTCGSSGDSHSSGIHRVNSGSVGRGRCQSNGSSGG